MKMERFRLKNASTSETILPMKTPLKLPLGDKKFVGIWIRVSTDEQAQGDSPKHHELRARAYAESKGWIVQTVYDLAGVTGKSVIDHPEAKRMMADVECGHITGLIFSKLARFARNTKELLEFAEFFQGHRADLISIQEAIDTSTPAGRLFFTVSAGLAQFEREEIASRVAASIPIRAKLGKPIGGFAPFGYRWEGKQLVLDPKDAPVRKLAYELFAEHKRKKTVARLLNERGFRTRDGKSRKGGMFSSTTVSRLISDTTAKGEHRANYTKSLGSGKQWAFKPEHEWVVKKVPAIVPVELWETCNAILEARKTSGKVPAKKGKSAFTGFVVCHCGKKMYVPYNTPKWVCYTCRNKIPAADLDALFRDELKAFMVAPEKVALYLATTQSGAEGKKELLAGLQKEREKVKGEAERCFALYDGGALTVPQFKERFQPIDARRQEIEREMPRLEAEIAALSVNEVSVEHIASEGRSFYDNWPTFDTDRKRTVVELFLRNIVVGKEDVSLNLFTLPVFEMMTDCEHTPYGVVGRRVGDGRNEARFTWIGCDRTGGCGAAGRRTARIGEWRWHDLTRFGAI